MTPLLVLTSVGTCLNDHSFQRRIYENAFKKRRRNCAHRRYTKSRLKSRAESSVVVDKFPLRRVAASWTRFHGIARPAAARNRFPARRAEKHYVEPSPVVQVDAGSCIPGGAILSGKLFRRNEVPSLPRTTSIYQTYSSLRHYTI